MKPERIEIGHPLPVTWRRGTRVTFNWSPSLETRAQQRAVIVATDASGVTVRALRWYEKLLDWFRGKGPPDAPR